MKIEWDPDKARLNVAKHQVSFQEAATVLFDTMAVTNFDPDHSANEDRYITFGLSARERMLVVAHTETDDTIRIINARIATRRERTIYEEK